MKTAYNTKMINKPLKKFKNPNKRSQPTTSPLSKIGLVLPNGRIVILKLDNEIILGRGKDTIDDATKVDLEGVEGLNNGISRNHTLLRMTDDTVTVMDYQSLNGTYLNDAELYPMRKYVLQDGDTLTLGKVKILIKFLKDNR